MAGKRHRWGEPLVVDSVIERRACACGTLRYKDVGQSPWFNVPAGDGRFRFVDGRGRVPPCPGRPEEKKP